MAPPDQATRRAIPAIVAFSAVLLPAEGRSADDVLADVERILRPLFKPFDTAISADAVGAAAATGEGSAGPPPPQQPPHADEDASIAVMAAPEVLDDGTAMLTIERRFIDPNDEHADVFYAPDALSIDLSSTPLLPSALLYRATSHRLWPLVLVVAGAAGVALSSVALDFATPVARYVGYIVGFFLLLVPLLMHALGYYRGVVRLLTLRFEFWYLSLQIIIFSACETVRALDVFHPVVALTPRFVLTGVAMVGLLCIDATALSRVMKGGVMAIGALLFVGLGATWRFSNPVASRIVPLGVFTTSLGSLATSAYLTLGTFCAKFAVNALVFKREVILLQFQWKEDKAVERHARRAHVVHAQQRRSSIRRRRSSLSATDGGPSVTSANDDVRPLAASQ